MSRELALPRRSPRIRLPLLIAIAATLLAICVYIFGLAAYQARGSSLLEVGDLIIPRSIDIVILIWCMWVGSSIGSFLNVVAWRMPRGESINGRSYCPRCRAQLRARDNFPIFGWLGLGGRCRTCHLPISARYPIVETIVGASLTLISIGQLYRLSLPRQVVHWHGGPLWSPAVDGAVLLTLFYHVVGLSLCWACGLIRMDGHRLPSRLVGFALLATILPMLACPTLMVVPWQMRVGETWNPDGLYVDALIRIISALAAATVFARYLAHGLCPAADPKLDPLGPSTGRLMDLIVILAIPTILVGWQAAPAVTVVASLIAVGLQVLSSSARRTPGSVASPGRGVVVDALGRFAIAMPMALTFQILFWRPLHATSHWTAQHGYFSFWPSDGGSPWVVLSWLGLLLLVPLWLRESSRVVPGARSVGGDWDENRRPGDEMDHSDAD